GEFFMIGGYAFALLATDANIPLWLAILAAILAGMIAGWLTERLLLRPLYAGQKSTALSGDAYAIIVTFWLSLFLINLAHQVFGPSSTLGPHFTGSACMTIFILSISPDRLVAAGVGVVVMMVVILLLRYSLWGNQV